MAALTTAAVSLYPAVSSGGSATAEIFLGPNTKGSLFTRRLKLVLTGQGGATNTISATALGFSQLVDAGTLWDATNSKGYPSVVDPVNNILILLDGSAAPAPVDVTTTAAYVTVTGFPFVAVTAPV